MRNSLQPAAQGPVPALIVRADAGPAIGFGHAGRMLSLLAAWPGDRVLLSHRPSEYLLSRAAAAGASVEAVPARHPEESDRAFLASRISRAGAVPPVVAVDGYAFDADYLSGLTSSGAFIVRIDDAPASIPPCRAFLDQNFGAEARPLSEGASLELLGARYALLPPSLARAANRARPDLPSRMVVSFGGGATDEALLLAARALSRLSTTMDIVMVLGPECRAEEAVRAALDGRIVELRRTADLPTLLQDSDVAVLGGGVSMLEACAAGVPTAVLQLAENQAPGVRALAAAGAVAPLGVLGAVSPDAIAASLRELLSDSPRRASLSKACLEAVDGRGAARVSSALIAAAGSHPVAGLVSYRRAAMPDSREIWRVANDPAVRANSFSPARIPWETHERWFRERISACDEEFWVADAGCVAGYFRLTPVPGSSSKEVHFYVHQAFRGRGLGTDLLRAAVRRAAESAPGAEVIGKAFADNPGSVRSFAAAGFASVREERIGGRILRTFCAPFRPVKEM